MASVDDHRLARHLATAAGATLLRLRSELVADGVERAEVGARADATAHDLLVGRLAEARPGDAVLSEEATAEERADRSRLASDRVWIVDPLDGTRELAEGRSDWAVHVALVEGHLPTAGAVALPDRDLVYGTDDPPGVKPAHDPPRLVLSRSRPPAAAEPIAHALGATLVPMGSAGAKAMAVLRGDAEIYLHIGAMSEWDACAPAAVALAAGLHVSRLDGSPLRFNKVDVVVPDLLVCHPDLAGSTVDAASDVLAARFRTGQEP